jgi:hypothetical protein
VASKEKEALGPFAGWPGADEWAGNWAAVLEANRVALDRWTKVGDSMLKGMFAVSQEMTQFSHSRLKEDARNCETLSQCHNPSEALSCQRRFAEAAAAEYLEEANKLTALMAKIASDGFASLQHPGAEKVSTA